MDIKIIYKRETVYHCRVNVSVALFILRDLIIFLTSLDHFKWTFCVTNSFLIFKKKILSLFFIKALNYELSITNNFRKFDRTF